MGVLRGNALVTDGQNGEFTSMNVFWKYMFILLVKICYRLSTAFGNEGETLRGSRKFVYAAEKRSSEF